MKVFPSPSLRPARFFGAEMCPVAAYKALPASTYGCEREVEGGLASLSEELWGCLLPRAVHASIPSREGHIIAMRILHSQATQRRKR